MNALQQVSYETILTPALGRYYSTTKEMVDAWKAGKDFQISNGQYCSIRDIAYLKDTSSRVALTQDFYEYIIV